MNGKIVGGVVSTLTVVIILITIIIFDASEQEPNEEMQTPSLSAATATTPTSTSTPTTYDGSEDPYPETKCGTDYFYCSEDKRCISRKLICDQKFDCSEGSEEANCNDYPSTKERDSNFICNDGESVNFHHICYNEVSDCEDESDEAKCDFRGKKGACDDGQFTCVSDGRCIQGSWRKDGITDCDDGSDEGEPPMPTNLTDIVKACNETEEWWFDIGWSTFLNRDYFLCFDTLRLRCLGNIHVCDGKIDCPNGEEERNCKTTTIDWSTFHCRNGMHVPKSQRCDGTRDCEDGSDEINCYKLESKEHSFKLRY